MNRGLPALATTLALLAAGCSSAATSTTTSTAAAPASTTTAGGTAPSSAAPQGDPNVLSMPALSVSAPVKECSTRNKMVTPPPDIRSVCRWTGSQPMDAAAGTTIIVGHSTKDPSSKGALEDVRRLKVGDTATIGGRTWKVAEVLPGVDKRKLPAWVTASSGARQLGLITCEVTNDTHNDIARLVAA
ncbi:class F sortase [Arsenicicoccus dermatophilus]|uniref:class F sortase n=1 Tax=Arsenicicoccus dermatophilus TaxID=1076331 RepID=UPI001F4D12B7|nr:class F sortase [Arsenicicoccus dermatophilus]MCH8611821.1 class F sortase [Arsenicicoccus dermatophilus]